jgi:tyrosyl-tRNA synthetase
LSREYAKDKKMRFSPVIISHHMLMGLKEGQEKMSKSDPDSAIFMEDSVTDVGPLPLVFLFLLAHISLR